jgi:hypothetical protein
MSSALTRFEGPMIPGAGRNIWRSITVRPGEVATPESNRYATERQELLKLVRQFSIDGLSWQNGQSATISDLTHQTAHRFLSGLPARKAFPKISPDGEGGLMMVWEGASVLVITIDDLKVHMVTNATTPNAHYLNDIVLGDLIDPSILDAIPHR